MIENKRKKEGRKDSDMNIKKKVEKDRLREKMKESERVRKIE